jgi:cytochrome c oxidase cbb3-type subunit 3
VRKRCLVVAVVSACVVTGCDRPPSADHLREWTPTDHDRVEENAKQQAAAPKGSSSGADALVEATWKAQCFQCHGPVGRGDGPNGPMVKASDLTSPEWQDKTSDLDIAATIKNGKGKMPKFDLPDPVVRGLVARIRATRGR